jgi:carboxymethylenebutenolidase
MKNDPSPSQSDPQSISRREFTALSLAAGVVAATGSEVAAAASVVEKDVEIKTADGVCDAALVHPQGKGNWPAAILFPDAFGLRPAMRDMAKRLAADGYTVLVPNQFYRSGKLPPTGLSLNFDDPASRAKFTELRAVLTNENVAKDAIAFTAFLDAQPAVNKKAKVGVFGYCMGGPMTMQSAAAVPTRIGAGASFHGGGLVTDKPDSPHLLVPKMKADFYFAVAANDDEKQPDAKTKLAEAYKAASLPAKVEVYEGTLHGWCVKDMPAMGGNAHIYNEPQAERAWKELVTLFKRTLV